MSLTQFQQSELKRLKSEIKKDFTKRLKSSGLITVKKSICGGKPCIVGTRLTIQEIIEYFLSSIEKAYSLGYKRGYKRGVLLERNNPGVINLLKNK